MNINIFGSTGNIGTKTLSIIKNNFPFIQVNLLLANKNYKKLLHFFSLFKFFFKFYAIWSKKNLRNLVRLSLILDLLSGMDYGYIP